MWFQSSLEETWRPQGKYYFCREISVPRTRQKWVGQRDCLPSGGMFPSPTEMSFRLLWLVFEANKRDYQLRVEFNLLAQGTCDSLLYFHHEEFHSLAQGHAGRTEKGPPGGFLQKRECFLFLWASNTLSLCLFFPRSLEHVSVLLGEI